MIGESIPLEPVHTYERIESEAMKMKREPIRLISLLLCAVMVSLASMPAICVVAAADADSSAPTAKEAVVYLREGGTGDGSSASSPIGTLSGAMNAAAAYTVTAKIQVIGEYRMDFASGAFFSPSHSNLIVISGTGTQSAEVF